MKTRSFNEIKQRESRRRSLTSGSKGTRDASRQQHRASLAGGGENWQITNLRQFAVAMAKWA